MPDTLTAAPAQGEIHQPLSDTGKSILSTIFDAPVRPEEVKRDVDLGELKKELGDKFQDTPPKADEPPKKSTEDEEKEFTKQFQKKDDETEVEKPKDEPKKEEKKEDAKSGDLKPKTDDKAPDTANKEEDDDKEATGKIKNVQDARKFYKEAKKKLKEAGEKAAAAEKETAEAREELKKLKEAPRPDADKIAAAEKELAEYKAKEEFLNKRAEELEQRASAYNIQDTEPYNRLVNKPLETLGRDLDDLVQAISDDKADQQAMYQAVGRALSIEDPKARRKAFEELGAPLTSMQQSELIQIEKGHRRVMGDKAKLLGDSQTAMQIIKAKQDTDRKEWIAKNANEFKAGALAARAELKEKYKFFERTDLPDDVKAEITELETAIDKIDPSQLPAKEVGKLVEGYYRQKILNGAASKHIAIMEKAEKEFKAKLEEALKKIEELEKNQTTKVKDDEAKKQAVDGTRPNLDTGNTNTEEPGKIDTIQGMVQNLFRT